LNRRTRNGWLVASIGISLVMPVVFLECLACDSFFKTYFLGHVSYDLAILLLTLAHSWAVWRGLERDGDDWMLLGCNEDMKKGLLDGKK
jgi:hypothetical protein